MIPQPDRVTLIVSETDKWGTVISSSSVGFDCLVQHGTQVVYRGNQVIVIGKGVIFTTENRLTFTDDQEMNVDGVVYNIVKTERLTNFYGEFSHYELIYG